MLWLIIAIFAYLSLAVVSLFDRYLLVGAIPNPKNYTFFAAVIWLFTALLFLPFGVSFLTLNLTILGLGTGAVRILAILFLAESIKRNEISRTIPAIGGFLPIFSFIIFFLYDPRGSALNLFSIIAFALLVLGSVLISFKGSLKNKAERDYFFSGLKYPVISALLFAFNFFLTKILFLNTSFVNGFAWPLLGGGLVALLFLISPRQRKEIFSQKINQKISSIFLLGQISGGLGVLLQYYAIFIASASKVPLINALEGVRYVFLLIFVFLLGRKNPNLLKEETSGSAIFWKVFAIFLIGLGIIMLSIS